MNVDYSALLKFLGDSDKNIESFCENCLGFQKNKVWETIQNAKDLIADGAGELQEDKFRPSFLIPPYFLYSSSNVVTNELNKKILAHLQAKKDQWGDIFPMLFVKRADLGSTFLDGVITDVKSYGFPGYCIWIDEFDERTASKEEIKGLIKLVKALSENGKQVVSLYGGFFSLLLSYFGISCVCHGLAYGEAKAISAAARQSSGPAPIRYYSLELHSFLTLDNAVHIFRSRPDLLCSCPACQRVVRGDPERVANYADEEAFAEIHFLWNRNQERKQIQEGDLNGMIENLSWTYDLISDLMKITKKVETKSGFEERKVVNPEYINAWKDALTEESSSNRTTED